MTPEEEESRKADLALVQSHVTAFGEQFDTVQIFVTRHAAVELDGTINIGLGAGNYFARFGQVVEWQVKQNEQSCIDRRHNDE